MNRKKKNQTYFESSFIIARKKKKKKEKEKVIKRKGRGKIIQEEISKGGRGRNEKRKRVRRKAGKET